MSAAVQAISNVPKRTNAVANLVLVVETFAHATTFSPDSAATALTVSKIWPSMGKLQSRVQCADMENCVARRIIMQSYWRAYEWIEAIFNTSANSSEGPVYWHTPLINALTQLFNDRTRKQKGTQTFTSKDYLPEITKRQVTIVVPRHSFRDSAQLSAIVSDSFYRIVATWLGYPSSSTFRIQACFVNAIYETLGDVLLLDEVWNTFHIAQGMFHLS